MHSAISGRRALLRMTWSELAFLHWPVDADAVRSRLPAELELDTFEGRAWIGIVPFEMRGVRFMACPPLPTATRFPELNVRTYVRHAGRPGVWFFSLDAASKIAVRGARATFALPYLDAHMSIDHDRSEGLRFRSERRHRGAPGARFDARYGPIGPAGAAAPGSLEHFLTERYSLFAARGFGVDRSLRRGLIRGDIEHQPWPLQPGEVQLDACELFQGLPFAPGDEAPIVHFARSIDVWAFAPRRVAGSTARS